MMFSEVGGLYDFLVLLLSTVLGFFSKRHLLASLIQKLFHEAPKVFTKKNETIRTERQTIDFNPLSFNASFIIAQFFTMGCCYREKLLLRHKALLNGMNRVEDSLDVVKLVQSFRSLENTFERLLMTKDERRLIRLQRRQSVLE